MLNKKYFVFLALCLLFSFIVNIEIRSEQITKIKEILNYLKDKYIIRVIDDKLPIYFHVNRFINLIPTELNLIKDLRLIESRCKNTICLTARSKELIKLTLDQLKRNNISLNAPKLKLKKLDFNFEY